MAHVRDLFRGLAAAIVTGGVTVAVLRAVQKQAGFRDHFEAVFSRDAPASRAEDFNPQEISAGLAESSRLVEAWEATAGAVDSFLHIVGSLRGAADDVEGHSQQLSGLLESLPGRTVSTLVCAEGQPPWEGFPPGVLLGARTLAGLRRSVTFANLLHGSLEPSRVSADVIGRAAPELLTSLKAAWAPFLRPGPRLQAAPLREALSLWGSRRPYDVFAEAALVAPCFGFKESDIASFPEAAVRVIVGFQGHVRLAEQIKQLMTLFELDAKASEDTVKGLDALIDVAVRSGAYGPLEAAEAGAEEAEEGEGGGPSGGQPGPVGGGRSARPPPSGQESITVRHLLQAYGAVKTLMESLGSAGADLVECLSSPRVTYLLRFLHQHAGEDFRRLIDSVEERSETFINEGTISNLVEVNRVIMIDIALLTGGPGGRGRGSLGALLDRMRGVATKLGAAGTGALGRSILQCAESVRSVEALFKNVANRGEATRARVALADSCGEFVFGLSGADAAIGQGGRREAAAHPITCWLRNRQGRAGPVLPQANQANFSFDLADLQDLRSRVLLIVNSEGVRPAADPTGAANADRRGAMERFIKEVEEASAIVDLASKLYSEGHFSFRRWLAVVRPAPDADGADRLEKLHRLAVDLQARLEDWTKLLQWERARVRELAFFSAQQLWTLHDLLLGSASAEVRPQLLDLLSFVNPNVAEGDVLRGRAAAQAAGRAMSPEERLHATGAALAEIFRTVAPFSRPIPHSVAADALGSCAGLRVSSGVPLVVRVDPQATLPALLGIYARHGYLPEPHQVLLCQRATADRDVELLCLRCAAAGEGGLFCVAGIEALDFPTQSALVGAVRRLQRSGAPFLLALICAGVGQHHVLDSFRSGGGDGTVHAGAGLSAAAVARLIGSSHRVTIVTADRALGKTALVRARSADRRLLSVPISGPIEREALVRALHGRLSSAPGAALHLDVVADVSEPAVLNSLLFELLVLGCAVAGDVVLRPPAEAPIFVEVAATFGDRLLDGLPLALSAPLEVGEESEPLAAPFTRVHLGWSLERFVPSGDAASDVQVVCRYLDALESGELLHRDLSFPAPGAAVGGPALTDARCRALLNKHLLSKIPGGGNDSADFSLLASTLAVLATHLRDFTQSPFFLHGNIQWMGVVSVAVRPLMVGSLVDVAAEFALAASAACSASQRREMAAAAGAGSLDSASPQPGQPPRACPLSQTLTDLPGEACRAQTATAMD